MKNGLFAVVLFFVSFVLLLLAAQNANPTSPLFPIQRINESIIFLTKRTPAEKIEYYQYLLQKRLSEINLLIQTGDGLLSETQLYLSTVSKAISLASHYNLRKQELKSELQQHKKIMENLVKRYSFNDDRQKFIKDDIYYINTFGEKL